MKMEAEIRAIQPHAKECLEPPEDGRARRGAPGTSGTFGGRVFLLAS